MTRRGRRWMSKHRSVRRPVQPHAIPGTIIVDPQAPQPRMTVIAYGPQAFEEREIQRVAEIQQWRGRFPVVWINVDGLGNADLIRELGQMFGLHPLALEDVVNTHQRAKCDDYGEMLYFVVRMLDGPPLESEQLSLFVGSDVVLTFQEDRDGDSLEPVRQRIRLKSGRIRDKGTDYLLYELVDAVVEGYFPVMERYGEQLDQLDEETDIRQIGPRLMELHHLRSDLLYLRRVVWPHRDALQTLLRGGRRHIHQEAELYFRDCYDHMVQIIDILEIYRESCSDLRDFLYSKVNNRTNEIMRVLTIISTIFLPMTFIAGVYGMNFDNMPELHWRWGYLISLGVMATIGCSFLAYFYRRGWLRDSTRMPRPASQTDSGSQI